MRVFPDAPAGFGHAGVRAFQTGRIEAFKYDRRSRTPDAGRRSMCRPDTQADKKYPVLYLLHGIGGDRDGMDPLRHARRALDDLIADEKVER